ncbi:MAG: N-acetyltransferase [Clostridiales bacterium]|nr:N-acetyltransferase [Clostridiales bacterium]
MRNDLTIRPETPADYAAIDQLVQRTFAQHTGYSDGAGEVAFIHEIREKPYYVPELSLVAILDEQIVGHVMFSRLPLCPTSQWGGDMEAPTELLVMGPVAVHADRIHQGIGETMIRQGLERARAYDCKGIVVEGDWHYYSRFGFETSADRGIYATSGYPLQEPRCMMIQENAPGRLEGQKGYIVFAMYENA